MTGFKKILFTVEGKLYGPKIHKGYAKGGLVIHRLGRGWTISQASSGLQIRGGFAVSTRAQAEPVVDKLLALPIKWELPWDEMSCALSEHRGAVFDIVAL